MGEIKLTHYRFFCTHACLLAEAERVAREKAAARNLCPECLAEHASDTDHVPFLLSASTHLGARRPQDVRWQFGGSQ